MDEQPEQRVSLSADNVMVRQVEVECPWCGEVGRHDVPVLVAREGVNDSGTASCSECGRVLRLVGTLDVDATVVGIVLDAEGVRYEGGGFYYPGQPGDVPFPSARTAYRAEWDALNAERGYPWADNPWVWVYDFKLLSEEATE